MCFLQKQIAVAHSAMADTAAQQHNGSTIGDPSPSTTSDDMADAGNAVAAAAPVALPQPNPAAAGEFIDA